MLVVVLLLLLFASGRTDSLELERVRRHLESSLWPLVSRLAASRADETKPKLALMIAHLAPTSASSDRRKEQQAARSPCFGPERFELERDLEFAVRYGFLPTAIISIPSGSRPAANNGRSLGWPLRVLQFGRAAPL